MNLLNYITCAVVLFSGGVYAEDSFKVEWFGVRNFEEPVKKSSRAAPVEAGLCPFICQGACKKGHSFAVDDKNSCHTYPCRCVRDPVDKTSSLFLSVRPGNMLEGDILVSDTKKELIEKFYGEKPMSRSVFQVSSFYWKKYKKYGLYYIPYVVDRSITDKQTLKNIPLAIQEFRQNTCIRFIKRKKHTNYIRIKSDDGCYAHIGMNSGEQFISLQNGKCTLKGTVMHELMHALGFFHEHSRSDRESYIHIRKQNIIKGFSGNFNKRVSSISLGSPYDYGSIMHYKLDAFSANGRNTIVPLKKTNADIGQRNGFSKIDIEQINTLYPCARFPVKKPTTSTTIATTKTTTTPQPTTVITKPSTTAKTQTKTCKDRISNCEKWKQSGYCETNNSNPNIKVIGDKFCNATCNRCAVATQVVTKPSVVVEDCKDVTKESSCKSWKARGYCTESRFKNYLKTQCYKTCGYCVTTKSAKDTQNEPVETINDERCGVTSFRDHHFRIVGGRVVTRGSVPWQVNLNYDGKHLCGGALLNREWIITAAHCLSGDLSHHYGYLGQHYKDQMETENELMVTFSERVLHPNYNKATKHHDIALLRISRPIQYTKYIRPVCLSHGTPGDTDEISVSGWGWTKNSQQSSEELRKVILPVINSRECNSRPWRTAGDILPGMMCAGYKEGGKDACQGDSGGPAVMQRGGYYELVGIVSWGYGCAANLSPGVYSNVYYYRQWIERTTQ